MQVSNDQVNGYPGVRAPADDRGIQAVRENTVKKYGLCRSHVIKLAGPEGGGLAS